MWSDYTVLDYVVRPQATLIDLSDLLKPNSPGTMHENRLSEQMRSGRVCTMMRDWRFLLFFCWN